MKQAWSYENILYGIYIKWSFSVGYFDSNGNFKSDYLELLLSVVHKYLDFFISVMEKRC